MRQLQFRTTHTDYRTRVFNSLEEMVAWKQVLAEVSVTGVAEEVKGDDVTPVSSEELSKVKVTEQQLQTARRSRANSKQH